MLFSLREPEAGAPIFKDAFRFLLFHRLRDTSMLGDSCALIAAGCHLIRSGDASIASLCGHVLKVSSLDHNRQDWITKKFKSLVRITR